MALSSQRYQFNLTINTHAGKTHHMAITRPTTSFSSSQTTVPVDQHRSIRTCAREHLFGDPNGTGSESIHLGRISKRRSDFWRIIYLSRRLLPDEIMRLTSHNGPRGRNFCLKLNRMNSLSYVNSTYFTLRDAQAIDSHQTIQKLYCRSGSYHNPPRIAELK